MKISQNMISQWEAQELVDVYRSGTKVPAWCDLDCATICVVLEAYALGKLVDVEYLKISLKGKKHENKSKRSKSRRISSTRK